MRGVLAEKPAPSRSRAPAGQDLVGLASPVFQIIMRVKAGLVTPSRDLRQTIAGYLKQMEQQREAAGYREAQVQAAKFALAAFVDETVLTADFPLRTEWEKYPLQLEYFGEHLAGVTFFNRLNDLLKDMPAQADVLEVYYLCLLLGFKGKYKLYYEEQLKGIIATVADQLRRVNRLRAVALSPHWRVDDQPPPPAKPGLPLWLKLGGGIMLGSVLFLYLIFYFWLDRILYSAQEQLLR